ncbi:hypothetical protein Echvi_3498 [Echinicola vietnamensis DSM 17526]|uniref:Uncharacterized protein n=1 Tax=Echinicola vietnamensis (strain DSM 17526 / LMG 23754 / KMM 6221) TaxID=926556 RepID=L0G0J4_ECHVK|nr:hypothetical protein Echvi_3498 [Echinicola vietnamensis DSM 17526]
MTPNSLLISRIIALITTIKINSQLVQYFYLHTRIGKCRMTANG